MTMSPCETPLTFFDSETILGWRTLKPVVGPLHAAEEDDCSTREGTEMGKKKGFEGSFWACVAAVAAITAHRTGAGATESLHTKTRTPALTFLLRNYLKSIFSN